MIPRLALVVLVFMHMRVATSYHTKPSSVRQIALEPPTGLQMQCSLPEYDEITGEAEFNCEEVIQNGQLAECQHDLATEFAYNAAKFGLDYGVPEFSLKGFAVWTAETLYWAGTWLYSDNCPGAETSLKCTAMIKQCDPRDYANTYKNDDTLRDWFCSFWDWVGIKPIVLYLQGEKPDVECKEHLGEFMAFYTKRSTANTPNKLQTVLFDLIYKYGIIAQWYHGLYMAMMAAKLKSSSCARYRGLYQDKKWSEQVSPTCAKFQKYFCPFNNSECTTIMPFYPVPEPSTRTRTRTTPLPITTTITLTTITITTTTTITYPKNPNRLKCNEKDVIECLEDMAKLFAILAVQRGALGLANQLGDLGLGIVSQEFTNMIVSISGLKMLGGVINDMFKKNTKVKHAKMCVLLIGKCRPNLANLFTVFPTNKTFSDRFCSSLDWKFSPKLVKKLLCLKGSKNLLELNCGKALQQDILDMATGYIGDNFENGLDSWTKELYKEPPKDGGATCEKDDAIEPWKTQVKRTLQGLLFVMLYQEATGELKTIKNSKINWAEFYSELNKRINPDFDGVTVTTTQTLPEWEPTTTTTETFLDAILDPDDAEDIKPITLPPDYKNAFYPLPTYTDIRSTAAPVSPMFRDPMAQPTLQAWQHVAAPVVGKASNVSWNAMIRSKAATMSPMFRDPMALPTMQAWQQVAAPVVGKASNVSWNAMIAPKLPFWQYMSAAATRIASNVSWHH